MKRRILIIAIAIAIVGSIFLALKIVGVDIKTTTTAFVLPAMVHVPESLGNADTMQLDITPAPWPSEAVWIYRLAQLGVPVKITLEDASPTLSFVITRPDSEGHLLATCRNRSDLNSLRRVMASSAKG
ncbi:hypothetical protein PO883_34225 [Massilia sp. DJPM01]|uniref:hypothetical protein n=1 Tax=Massilia sp. DJPM01 TaxID=3024404 RepID=UPI00259EA68F|nr:hypothetical protein [Massilia sp. DJPM01]MDM5182228.1 hypothetical protein [Massilia sp. DJPM01]